MYIAVCDDEKRFRDTLIQLLDVYSQKRAVRVICHEYKSGVALLKSTTRYDIIFLDYQMDALDGIETAKKLRMNNIKSAIIFLTSFPHTVFESFEVSPFRFLIKPIIESKLFKTLDDYLASFSENEYLIISYRADMLRIRFDDIIYVEAQNKTCIIHTVDDSYEYARVLSDVEKYLPKDRFFKSHKSFIVGLKHVKGRIDKDILLDNGDKAYLAVSKYTVFKDIYADYMKRFLFEPEEDEITELKAK